MPRDVKAFGNLNRRFCPLGLHSCRRENAVGVAFPGVCKVATARDSELTHVHRDVSAIYVRIKCCSLLDISLKVVHGAVGVGGVALASVAVSLVAVAEGFVVMAGINDVSVLRQVKNVQVGEFGGVVRFEHNRLAGCRCANYFVCIVQELVHQLRVCDGGFVQDFKNEHRVRSDGVQFGSDLCPQMQEMFLFGVVGFRIGAELVAGIVQFHIVVEVHDDGEALRQGELDIFLYAGETFGVDRMGAIVGILLPTNRETDGVEARRLDYGEIGIFDAVAPAAIQGVALRIPRVPQVHALA